MDRDSIGLPSNSVNGPGLSLYRFALNARSHANKSARLFVEPVVNSHFTDLGKRPASMQHSGLHRLLESVQFWTELIYFRNAKLPLF